jgi:nucleoid-associated protein YgaU
MTEATQQNPAPATRPGRSFAIVALVVVCLAAAAGGYFFAANRNAPVVSHVVSPPPAAVRPPQTKPAPVAAKPPAPVQQAKAVPAEPLPGATAPLQAQQVQAQPAAPQPAALPSAAPQPAAKAQPGAPHTAAPSVDVVRVDQYGSLVMAGRAQPGETLAIHSSVSILGTVTADPDGQWVFLPDAHLPSGVHQLSIADQKADPTDTAAQTTVLLSLPAQAGEAAVAKVPGTQLKAGPMVVLSQGNAPPRLLLGPPGSHPGPVGLDIVQYDDQGRIRFTGHAQPGRTVRLYVDDHAVGDAIADHQGLWTLAPPKDMNPGVYQLRTDELTANGAVMARSEIPFARASLTQALAPGQAVVQPGDCLWTIARHSFGRGIVYTAIFAANRDQIRDPRRIYPGQVFRLPTSDEAAHAPPPSTFAHHHRLAHSRRLRHHERHIHRPEGATSRG